MTDFICPYCNKELIGPIVSNEKVFYLCQNCEGVFDLEILNYLVLLSSAYTDKIAREVLANETSQAGGLDVISSV